MSAHKVKLVPDLGSCHQIIWAGRGFVVVPLSALHHLTLLFHKGEDYRECLRMLWRKRAGTWWYPLGSFVVVASFEVF